MNKRLLLVIKDNNMVAPSSNRTHYIFADEINKLEAVPSTSLLPYILYILRVNDERIYFTDEKECERMLQKILKCIESHFNIVDLNCGDEDDNKGDF